MDTVRKEQLAAVMERYGIEWEHLGTHENIFLFWIIKAGKRKRSGGIRCENRAETD